MEKNVLNKFQAFIYEAAYIALESGYFAGKNNLDSPELKAMERILTVFELDSREACENFIKEYDSVTNRQSAKYLCAKYLNPEKREFFSQLGADELILYHSANFDISREYGNYLGESFNMANMSIADIGGSSGGLLTGIADVCKSTTLNVFDTEAACEIGESINDNINFIPCDFFKFDFTGKTFDVVIVSNILHDWSNEKALLLLNNLKSLLEKCKYLIIHEDILDNSGDEPAETLVYGLRLAINEPGGRQRTFKELDKLVNELGCGLKAAKSLHFAPLSARIYSKAEKER